MVDPKVAAFKPIVGMMINKMSQKDINDLVKMISDIANELKEANAE